MARMNLYKLLKNSPYSQKDVAIYTGINKNTISRYVNNTFEKIDKDHIDLLCDFFKCTPNDLFDLEPIQQNIFMPDDLYHIEEECSNHLTFMSNQSIINDKQNDNLPLYENKISYNDGYDEYIENAFKTSPIQSSIKEKVKDLIEQEVETQVKEKSKDIEDLFYKYLSKRIKESFPNNKNKKIHVEIKQNSNSDSNNIDLKLKDDTLQKINDNSNSETYITYHKSSKQKD